MKLKTTDVIILLIFGLLCVTRGTWGIFKDVTINLSNAKSVTGQVVYAETIRIKKATIKITDYKNVFAIRLNNSPQRFAVDRGADFCKYLEKLIKTGDTLKMLYRNSTGEYNTFIFQIQKGNEIIADFNGYKKKQTEMIILCYFFGFIILGGLSFWYIKKRRQAV